MPGKIEFVSLGCPRALVDSEVMLAQLTNAGYQTCADPRAALVMIVNTCGFIEAGRRAHRAPDAHDLSCGYLGQPRKID